MEESKRSNTVGVDDIECKCILGKTHELLCAHELAEYGRVNMPIPLDFIDSHWRKQDMSSSVSNGCEVVVDVRNYWIEELDRINQCFIKPMILRR